MWGGGSGWLLGQEGRAVAEFLLNAGRNERDPLDFDPGALVVVCCKSTAVGLCVYIYIL